MSKFIELQGANGLIWIRVDRIVALWAHKFRYMDGDGYHDANGTKIELDCDDEEHFSVLERPSEVLAKIAEATSASQS